MFNVDNIISQRKEVRENISSVYGLLGSERAYLPADMQKACDELMLKMRELISEIERETGWKYNGYGFVFLSNYIYNAETEQIDFIENVVDYDGQNMTFTPKHNTKRETAFVKGNEEKLKLLARYTNHRNYYDIYGYDEMLEKDHPEIDALARAGKIVRPPQYIFAQREELISGELAARQFYNECGNDGLVTLVKWLNRLANAEKPRDVFDEILKEQIPEEMKQQILFWVSMYSTAGEDLEAEYYNRNNPKPIVTEGQKGK